MVPASIPATFVVRVLPPPQCILSIRTLLTSRIGEVSSRKSKAFPVLGVLALLFTVWSKVERRLLLSTPYPLHSSACGPTLKNRPYRSIYTRTCTRHGPEQLCTAAKRPSARPCRMWSTWSTAGMAAERRMRTVIRPTTGTV